MISSSRALNVNAYGVELYRDAAIFYQTVKVANFADYATKSREGIDQDLRDGGLGLSRAVQPAARAPNLPRQ